MKIKLDENITSEIIPLLVSAMDPGRLAQIGYFNGLLQQYDLDNWFGCHVVASEHRVRIRRP